MNLQKALVNLSCFLCLGIAAFAQAPPAALMPVPRIQFLDVNGTPLAGGFVYTYAAGTSTPLATFADSTGNVNNSNPVALDSGGFATIWLGPQAYKIAVTDSNNAPQYTVDNVSNVGQLLYNLAVLLSPSGGALQTVAGPLGATYFQATAPHFTSPGVRVGILDPSTVLDTLTNPPTLAITAPAAAGQTYTIPDPLHNASVVLSPNPGNVNGSGNVLDCTQNGLTCKRTSYIWFDGGACNNSTAGLGFDTFGSNSPTPLCVTGSNVQKGVLAFPSAATPIQSLSCIGAAATTCVVAMGISAHDLPVIACAVDGSKTVSGVTDGTNVYSKAISIANGATDLEIWYFNGDAAPVTGNVTVTLSAAGNSACRWREYSGLIVASILDKTASSTGTSVSPSTGTTAGTAQNVELVLAAVASPSNPSVAGATGFTEHGAVAQSTNVSVDSEAKIQQATSTQAGSFTLGTSQAWASAIATFKVNVAGTVTAQRQFGLPAFYDSTRAVNAGLKWQAPLIPIGTVNVALGAAIACTADGNTDDSAFNSAVTATPAVSQSSANIVTTTALSALTSTGCAANSLLHFQVQRLRYNASDTYEGYVYLSGAALQFGITQ